MLKTIQDVQKDDTSNIGTAVELHGVVVTAVDKFGMRNGEVWVEAPEGGPRSGIAVFGAPLSQVTNLAAGDLVDITGAVKSKFVITGDTTGVVELVAPSGGMMTFTKTGTGTVPAPAVVDALAIGVMATDDARQAAWRQWEGVLIQLSNVAAAAAPSCIKSKGTCTDVDSFGVTGVIKVESSLSAFPAAGVQGGDCFASVTGIVDYAFGYLIYPRTTNEMMTGGTACIIEKSTGTTNLCTDGLDNDGNGFSDCKDFGCEVGPGAWLGASCAATDTTCGCSANLPTTGVNKVNTGTVGAVLLHNVIVTAVGTTGYWVADAAQAVANGGLFVLTNAVPDVSIVIGAQLGTLQGISTTFDASKTANTKSLIEISHPTATAVTASGATLLPITTATAATLADPTNGAPFAGSLVQLANLKVATVDAVKQVITLTDNAAATITMTNHALADFGGTEPAVGDCYTTLAGVMDFNTADPQTRTINPTKAADLVKGTGCN
ncbi:MAG TPA: hypothetical protein VH165_08875 [Kofleriaceae bacterium]|nr:hypothetical protein [Kofleriaceae bacterium]